MEEKEDKDDKEPRWSVEEGKEEKGYLSAIVVSSGSILWNLYGAEHFDTSLILKKTINAAHTL